MTVREALPNCRRKALLAFASGASFLGLSWAAHALQIPIGEPTQGILAGLGAGLLVSAVLLWFSPDISDAVPKSLLRRYHRDVAPAMAAYIGVMLVWKKLLDWVELPAWRVLVALLPALLVLWIMQAFVRYVRASDEMQRRIELESGASAGLLVSAMYMAAGFLQTAKLIDVPSKLAMLGVFPALCFTYGIARVFIARRYQ
jgi:hypothetical protein